MPATLVVKGCKLGPHPITNSLLLKWPVMNPIGYAPFRHVQLRRPRPIVYGVAGVCMWCANFIFGRVVNIIRKTVV